MPEAKLVVSNEQPDAIDHPKSELQHHIQLDLFDFRHYYSTIDLNENLIIKNEITGESTRVNGLPRMVLW